MQNKIRLGLVLSKGNIELSAAEAKKLISAYFNISKYSLESNLLILDAEIPDLGTLLSALSRLAYLSKAYLLFDKETVTDTINIHSTHTNNEINGATFAISKEVSSNISRANLKRASLVDALENAGLGKVNLSKPDLKFAIIAAGNISWGLLIWENLEDFNARKAHKRARLHPTSMDPRLARCMVNLSGARSEVLDPFCGAGGILIEAKLMGLDASGIDIDKEMLNRARENLEGLNLRAKLMHGNSLEHNGSVEAVVCDLPLGKSSKLESGLAELVSAFLDKYKEITRVIVVGFPDESNIKVVIRGSGWEVKERFSIYIHKSYTKVIYVLEKSDCF